MKFPQPIPIKTIAKKINAEIIGDDTLLAIGINEIHKVEQGDITFVDVAKYFDKSLNSAATIIIVSERVECPPGKALLLSEKPFEDYNSLVLEHRPYESLRWGIHPTANIHPSVVIEPNVVIGPHVKIGAGSHIQANVVIAEHSLIGKNVLVQSGSVIGTEAFYFKKNQESYKKWRSGGRVILEDRVDIGACCTINKGVSGDTIIGEGSKLDGQVHIGHGVVLGKNCLLAAQVGIGGKTIVGNNVILYGQVGIAQNLTIGDDAIILAKSGVSKSLEGGKTYFGAPAEEARKYFRMIAAMRKLPELLRRGI
ncbi:MAG: UDP-3-O-[3-hydroxymyristoyl] glucosamine N-acyltransferase [Polaribacter sp.]|jgi:UDP-3-O-[3-hydroxymyristoyl] glucosamine N-acyltransferase